MNLKRMAKIKKNLKNMKFEFFEEVLETREEISPIQLHYESPTIYYKKLIKKIDHGELNDTKKLSEYIYKNIFKINEKGHKQEVIEYINRRFIFHICNGKTRKPKNYEEIYSQYEEFQIDKKMLRQKYIRFFEKYKKFEQLKINENITNFLFLAYDSLEREFIDNNFRSVVTFKYDEYTINNLMKFYCKLNAFIMKNKGKNNYIKIAYENLENIFYGYRFKLVMNELKSIINSKEKMKVLISLMKIRDINLSIYLIKKFLENIEDEQKIINIFERYNEYYKLYDILDKIIIISLKEIDEINIVEMEKYNKCDYYITSNINYKETSNMDELYKEIIEILDELE